MDERTEAQGRELIRSRSLNVRTGILGLRKAFALKEGFLDEGGCKGFQSNEGKGISGRRNLSKGVGVGK